MNAVLINVVVIVLDYTTLYTEHVHKSVNRDEVMICCVFFRHVS